jgi:hypothetical protein
MLLVQIDGARDRQLCAPGIRHVDQHRNTDMKARHFLARIAAFVTAAAIGMFLGPARADAADPLPRDLMDGWPNRDQDIGALSSSMAEELGSRLDGWDTPAMDLNPSDLWEAMAFGIGDILDGWANRDIDIGSF